MKLSVRYGVLASHEQRGNNSHAAAHAALVSGERESKDFDGLIRSPQLGSFARSEVVQPVSARVPKTGRPIVVQRVK